MIHTKQYSRTGTGVNLFCGKELVASSPHRDCNWHMRNCPSCGYTVITTGISPDTDIVMEAEEIFSYCGMEIEK